MFDWFHKMLPKNSFNVLLVKVFNFEKKTRSIYTRMLEFTFPRKDVIY